MDQTQLDKVKDYPFLIYKPYVKTLEEMTLSARIIRGYVWK